ncbi:hypothetical protein ACFLUX_03050 [Chloroflexota bacterium]
MTKGEKKVPVMRVFRERKAWLNIALLLLAGVIIVSGVYLSSQPEWTERADIKLYNQGVSAYLLPAELLPATEERPSEFPIIRAAAYFQQASSESTDTILKTLALYNLGTLMGKDALASISGNTSLFAMADGIIILAEAVRKDPNNEDAKYNLELLEKVQTAMAIIPNSISGLSLTFSGLFGEFFGKEIGTYQKGY